MILVSNFREEQYVEVAESRCIEIYIPNDDSFLAVLANLLSLLGNELNYVGIDSELAASHAQQWRNAYVLTDWQGCNEVTIPVGTIIPNVSDTPTAGWLLCDGTQYDRVDYPALSALIPEGTDNIGGTSDVFTVPNLVGRAVIGAGSVGASPANGYDLGQYVGAPTHTLTINQMPNHDHYIYNERSYAPFAVPGTVGGLGISGTGGSDSYKTGIEGGNSSHNNMQPSQAFFYWIYAGL
jgi:microcystin-dependent protein